MDVMKSVKLTDKPPNRRGLPHMDVIPRFSGIGTPRGDRTLSSDRPSHPVATRTGWAKSFRPADAPIAQSERDDSPYPPHAPEGI